MQLSHDLKISFSFIKRPSLTHVYEVKCWPIRIRPDFGTLTCSLVRLVSQYQNLNAELFA